MGTTVHRTIFSIRTSNERFGRVIMNLDGSLTLIGVNTLLSKEYAGETATALDEVLAA